MYTSLVFGSTQMPAGPPSVVVSLLPAVLSCTPMVMTSLPSRVNFCTRWCMWVPIQTKLLWSTKMPWGFRGHCAPVSGVPVPHACTTLPCASSSMTVGAAAQQVAMGGFCSIDVSSSVSVSGRWVIQTWSFASTNTPVTDPITQLFGNSAGQVASMRKVGAAGVRGACSAWSTRPMVATVSDSTSTRKAERVFVITNSFLSNGAGTRVP